MATISLKQLKSGAQNQIAQMDAQMQAAGYIRDPATNRYVRNPGYRDPVASVKDELSIRSQQLNILDKLNQSDPEFLKQQAVNKAQAEAEAKSLFPEPLKPSAEQTTAVADADTTLQGIGEIRSILQSNKIDTGRSQSFKGFFRNLLGPTVPGLGQSDEEQQFQFATDNLTANFIKFLSGAAVSDKERERLVKFLPQITDTRQEIKNKLAQLERFVTSRKTNIKSQFGRPSKPSDDPLGLFK